MTEREPSPKRVQMRCDRPWRKDHPDAVIVARPRMWGNPFPVGRLPHIGNLLEVTETPSQSVALYRDYLATLGDELEGFLAPLRGRDLACWCPLDQPCHADVLLELANRAEVEA